MKNPIGSFEIIKNNFIRYVKTAFSIQFEQVEKERNDLLETDKVFYRQPWIEPLPEYKSSKKKITELTENELFEKLSERELAVFTGLAGSGLVGNFDLYDHQLKMVKQALDGKHCVITSGTGSGKTESFLLPLFAQLSKELAHWRKPKKNDSYGWWDTLTPSKISDKNDDFQLSQAARQRTDEHRPAAVRALILYPMNALVEDQMTRLRQALDSKKVRNWLEENVEGNRIYFGRYNGVTPIPGMLKTFDKEKKEKRNDHKVKKLQEELKELDKTAQKVEQYLKDKFEQLKKQLTKGEITQEAFEIEKKKLEKEAPELRAFFPKLDGAEMRCRFDMQLTPPDILITNFSMLSIMLMRNMDAPIFEKTRAWLHCEDENSRNLSASEKETEKENRIFHLIIDELHLYRGTAGTEVAYLVKLLLHRLGLDPNHKQLKILASSASLEASDEDSLKYLSDFFGFENKAAIQEKFEIIPGELNKVAALKSTQKLHAVAFAEIKKQFDENDIKNENFQKACQSACEILEETFQISSTKNQPLEKLLELFLHPKLEMRERLFAACQIIENGKKTYRTVSSFPVENDDLPKELPYFSTAIFGEKIEFELLKNAVEGLLIIRSFFDEDIYKNAFTDLLKTRNLPRFRFHYFFRNIEGLWASVCPEDVLEKYKSEQRPVGKLFPKLQMVSQNNGKSYRVLELLRCENCGTLFYGGSRGETKGSLFEMLPVSPKIEGVPEKTPAKLVEQRTYQEYAVFWPQGEQDFIKHDTPKGHWKQTSINENIIPQSNFEANWIKASINVFSGDVFTEHEIAENNLNEWQKGYLFIVKEKSTKSDVWNKKNKDDEIDHTHKALPCVCPACGVNYQIVNPKFPKSKTSPVRDFRTGFGKSIQLFAKELMYQLPEDEKQRKLVVFSDSREDAASIANGIERNHFNELLREILIDELHRRLLLSSKIYDSIKNNDNTEFYKKNHADEFDEMEELMEFAAMPDSSNQRKQKRKREAQQVLKEKLAKVIKVNDLLESESSKKLAMLVRRLVDLGINPGGVNIHLQSVKDGEQNINWYEVFDFENLEWRKDKYSDFQQEIRNGNLAKLGGLFFTTLFYAFEASGLGYLTVNPELEIVKRNAQTLGLSKNEFLEILSSTIRVMGDKYKYSPNDFELKSYNNFESYRNLPSKVRKYIEAVATRKGVSEEILGEKIFETLQAANVLKQNIGIDVAELYIKLAAEDDPVWISEKGRRAHLHPSGEVCTFSQKGLQQNEGRDNCKALWEKNYLSYHAAIKKRPPIRLHCEELTGQTDDQFERQRHFRNIILDEGEPKVRAIDLLSVTTTLEVGVDIGALQALMLANMPPQRFNYQQRVGRAGRRGQAYSAILTFCRGRSHDEFYFNNPHKITGDPPPTPFLANDQLRITKRLIAKEVLRQVFQGLIPEREVIYSSVHGQFGEAPNWQNFKDRIVDWLQLNRNNILFIIEALKPDIKTTDLENLLKWCTSTEEGDNLFTKIGNVINNEDLKATTDLSQKLAEGGVLPMFGMPTTVKNFYHSVENKKGKLQLKNIDRHQDLAIFEFAPNSQKTKDKAIHTAIGFTDDLMVNERKGAKMVEQRNGENASPFGLERWMLRCKSCGFVSTYDLDKKPELTNCEHCGNELKEPDNIFQIKSPVAYRSDLSAGKDRKENTEIRLSQPPIFAEKEDNSKKDPKEARNYVKSISDNDLVWRVNTNGDKLFEGRNFYTTNYFPNAPKHSFSNQWMTQEAMDRNDELRDKRDKGSPEARFRLFANSEGKKEAIALAAGKNTEVFRLSPQNFDQSLDLDMFQKHLTKSSVGVRSAFFSAAFLLQRVLADDLDIAPSEIEIADIRRKLLDEKWITSNKKWTAEIILTDALPNGSGFTRKLFKDFEKYLDKVIFGANSDSYSGKIHSENHRKNCKDACYDCLKVFRNMNYHSLLDWRLGMALLRILSDKNYLSGTDFNFDYPELQGWKEDATQLRDNFLNSFGEGGKKFVALNDSKISIPAITNKKKSAVALIVHPLWNLEIKSLKSDNPFSESIFRAMEILGSEKNLFFLDTFNLHRRIGWCYEQLNKK